MIVVLNYSPYDVDFPNDFWRDLTPTLKEHGIHVLKNWRDNDRETIPHQELDDLMTREKVIMVYLFSRYQKNQLWIKKDLTRQSIARLEKAGCEIILFLFDMIEPPKSASHLKSIRVLFGGRDLAFWAAAREFLVLLGLRSGVIAPGEKKLFQTLSEALQTMAEIASGLTGPFSSAQEIWIDMDRDPARVCEFFQDSSWDRWDPVSYIQTRNALIRARDDLSGPAETVDELIELVRRLEADVIFWQEEALTTNDAPAAYRRLLSGERNALRLRTLIRHVLRNDSRKHILAS